MYLNCIIVEKKNIRKPLWEDWKSYKMLTPFIIVHITATNFNVLLMGFYVIKMDNAVHVCKL